MSMHFVLGAAVLDKILPFSFIVDNAGRIVWLGRSVRKICPDAAEGADYRELFCLEQPSLGMSSLDPGALVGEFVKLSVRRDSGTVLRGQVVALGAQKEQHLFSLIVDVTQASTLDTHGVDFGDFALGEPVVDLMILWRLFKQTRESLEAANARLAWRDLGTQLLLSLPAEILPYSEDQEIYSITLRGLCQALKWDVGHVFMTSKEAGDVLRSSPTAYLTDASRFSAFEEATQSTAFSLGEGLPGRAAESRSIVWVQDVTRDPLFPRRVSLAGIPRLTGVAIPIVVEDRVLAVLELFTERVFNNPDGVVRLLQIMRRQVEQQVARQHAIKRAREQEAVLLHASKMATLGELAAGVAHEINNPLSAISVTAEVLRRMNTSGAAGHEAVVAHANRITSCTSHIATIVSDLQKFSRDAARDPMSENRLADIVASTLHLCGAKFMNKRIELKVDDIPQEWVVTCRAPQVSQVLLNLINNAYDAVSHCEKPWVRVSVADEGDSFSLSVSDSGPGVPQEVQEKMMQAFYTTKPPGKGTGLGLSISRSLMQAHGGDLVFNEGSQHTTFTARLPKGVGGAVRSFAPDLQA